MLTFLLSFLSPVATESDDMPTPVRSFSKRRFGIIPKNPCQVSSMQAGLKQHACG